MITVRKFYANGSFGLTTSSNSLFLNYKLRRGVEQPGSSLGS